MPGIQRIQPAVTYAAITPSDTVDLTKGVCDSIYVGTAGDVAVVDRDGTAVTFGAVPAGTVLPVKALRVNATNTASGAGRTGLVALYSA